MRNLMRSVKFPTCETSPMFLENDLEYGLYVRWIVLTWKCFILTKYCSAACHLYFTIKNFQKLVQHLLTFGM
jgi:hypothetical protein